MSFEKLGKYTIVGRIGTGSMGEVYKATDPVLKRHVAIKTMAASAAADSQLVQRFHREAQSAARLNHPNIITVFDFGEEQGQLYMAMELLQGNDLKDLIGTSRLASLRKKLDLLEQVLEGVAFAHAQGVTHRDLKPGNIHVQPNGRVKILDFGLARPEESEMTQAGMVMGTPNYMSPEQVRGQTADARSDVFSLGAVAYEVLAGRRAFRAETMHKILQRVLMEDPEPLRTRVPDIPHTIEEWIGKAMRKDAAERYANAADMLEALRDLRAPLTDEILDQGAPLSDTEKEAYDQTITTDSQATVIEDAPTAARPRPTRGTSIRQRSRGSTALAPAASVARRPRQAPTLSGGARTTVTPPTRSPVVLFAGAALVIIVIGLGTALYLTRSGGSGADLAPDEIKEFLTDALVDSQLELAQFDLDNKDYQDAISQARTALELAPEHADALRIVEVAEQRLAELEQAATQARSAFEQGDTATASSALSRVMALDPRHPVAAELSLELNRFFQAQAEDARADMERSRTGARRVDATRADGYAAAETLAGEAADLAGRQQYAVATQRYLEARDGFERVRRQVEAQRAEEARIAAAATPAPTPAPRPTATPGRATPAPRPSVAPTAVPTAAPTAAPTQTPRITQPPVTAPPTPPPPPTLSPQESAARNVLAQYRQAFEGQNLAQLRQIYPGLPGNNVKQIEKMFKATKSHEMSMEVLSVETTGAKLRVRVRRQDTINGRQTPEVVQVFTMAQGGGGWIIESQGAE